MTSIHLIHKSFACITSTCTAAFSHWLSSLLNLFKKISKYHSLTVFNMFYHFLPTVNACPFGHVIFTVFQGLAPPTFSRSFLVTKIWHSQGRGNHCYNLKVCNSVESSLRPVVSLRIVTWSIMHQLCIRVLPLILLYYWWIMLICCFYNSDRSRWKSAQPDS